MLDSTAKSSPEAVSRSTSNAVSRPVVSRPVSDFTSSAARPAAKANKTFSKKEILDMYRDLGYRAITEIYHDLPLRDDKESSTKQIFICSVMMVGNFL